MKMRLDVYLTENKYCESRNKACSLIRSSDVFVNGKIVLKPSFDVKPGDEIRVNPDSKQYVARSAHKLLTAKEQFKLSFNGKTAVDLGASTGGFCQIMLENNIKKIYAIDIGTNQLHPDIRSDSRVISMENVNARYVTSQMFDDRIDIITCDLSFISLTYVLPAAFETLKDGGELVCLVKPQFEVGHSNICKNGVVKDIDLQIQAIRKVSDFAYSLGFDVKDACFSQLAGESGNREYLLYMIKCKPKSALSEKIIESRVREVQ